MVIQHNMQAMNTKRKLGITTGLQSKSTEKLSSGYRINRAADDAAGLTISEKMRWQTRGLNRASKNAEDAISLIQTAEGALGEVHSILQRMNELAVQGANDTNTDADREALQKEIDALTEEIDRVADTTTFNTKELLKTTLKTDDVMAVSPTSVAGTFTQASSMDYAKFTINTPAVGDTYTLGSKTYTVVEPGDVDVENDKLDITQTLHEIAKSIFAEQSGASPKSGIVVTSAGGWWHLPGDPPNPTTTYGFLFNGYKELNFQVGAQSGQKIELRLNTLNSAELGVYGLSVSNHSAAGDSISKIHDAIDTISGERSRLGAVQNRLEHTIANLDNTAENTTAAESKIRDTDMAEEMVGYSKNAILAQAGQSMLAQANQSKQGILSLIG